MSIYAAVILAYLGLLVFVSFKYGRSVESQEDFSVAGRSLPTMVVFLTMLATWTGTGSIFGNSEKTFQVGIAAWILPLGEIVGISLLIFLAGRARRLEQITVSDILERRFGSAARILGAVALILSAVVIVSYQYRAAETVIHLAWPELSAETARFLVVVFVIAYTAIAGMYSVAYTDVVMGATMLVGMTAALGLFWSKAGGIEAAKTALPPSYSEFFGPIGWMEFFGLLLPPMLLSLGDANMYQRFFSARSEGVAKKATVLTLLGVAYIDFVIIATAWFSTALEHGKLQDAKRVIPHAAQDFLPGWLGALLLTTILSIIVSTAIGYLLVPTTAVVRDFYQGFLRPDAAPKSLVRLSRALVLVLGLAAYGISTLSDEILDVAFFAYTIYGAGVTPSLVAALIWPGATRQGAVSSIAGGTAVTLLWKLSGLEIQTGVDAVLPAIVVSGGLLIGISLAIRGRKTLS